MRSICWCVLGQKFGNYTHGLRLIAPYDVADETLWAQLHGFERMYGASYEALEDAWGEVL